MCSELNFIDLLVFNAEQIPQFASHRDGDQFLPLHASLWCNMEDTQWKIMGITQENKFKSRCVFKLTIRWLRFNVHVNQGIRFLAGPMGCDLCPFLFLFLFIINDMHFIINNRYFITNHTLPQNGPMRGLMYFPSF